MLGQVFLEILTENVLGSVLAGVSAKEKPYGAVNNLLTVSAGLKSVYELNRGNINALPRSVEIRQASG